jgi:hypothetical protein
MITVTAQNPVNWVTATHTISITEVIPPIVTGKVYLPVALKRGP